MGGARLSSGAASAPAGATAVKICGVATAAHAIAAAEAGASYIGFVFEPRSPRAVTPAEAARISADLAAASDRIVSQVGLFVDPTDEALGAALDAAPLAMIQLHGHEAPERVRAVRATFGLPVMKALPIEAAADLAAIETYGAVADVLLVDAKPAAGAALTGGAGVAFDWSLLSGVRWPAPWMLAGGLTVENVAEAIAITGAPAVDVSSGVEAARGVKDAEKIRAFCAAAQRGAAPGADGESAR